MASLTNDQFREAVLKQYETAAAAAPTTSVAAQLDESLRGTFVKLWEKVLLLEGLTLRLPTGDPATIQLLFQGELDEVVETWQQSMLSRPRVTIPGNDPEFRRKVTERYNTPSATVLAVEIANSLDKDLSGAYITFWELIYQLHLSASELAETRDCDLGEQTKLNLQSLIKTWKESLLLRPRARTGQGQVASNASG